MAAPAVWQESRVMGAKMRQRQRQQEECMYCGYFTRCEVHWGNDCSVRGGKKVPKYRYKINRRQTGVPTAEEKWHDEIALKHYLKHCTSEKCIRGAEHQKKANWHEGFCLECAFNPYNMEEDVD